MIDNKEMLKSNASKLIWYTDRLDEFKRTGIMRPISLNMTLTNACNNKCEFCVYKYRNKSLQLSLQDAKAITEWYYDKGILAVEIIGGGEPTMYPYLKEYVEYCISLGLEVGMITNGMKLDHSEYSQKFLENFRWIRASVNWVIERWYPDLYNDYPVFRIPASVTFSFSYVWTGKSELHESEYIHRIERLLDANPHAVAMKIQPDVLARKKFYKPDFTNKKIFFNEKVTEARSKKCYMQLIKPQVEANGKIYRCSCGYLEKSLPDDRIVGDISNPPSMKSDKFDTSKCDLCFYSFYNDVFRILEDGVEHSEFV